VPPTRLEPPLADIVVIDASRMLPGAVLARGLLDLGARVIKVEHPAGGDLLRHVLPGRPSPADREPIGAGFDAFYGGAESLALDLRSAAGAEALERVSRRADVFVESFRPGTLAGWGLAPERLMAGNPRLLVCSLPGFETESAARERLAHDLNIMAESGLLDELSGGNSEALAGAARRTPLPGAQVADVTCGLLACGALLAALLQRHRTGRGGWIEQSLASGVRPFLIWSQADRAAGAAGFRGEVLGGGGPAYRLYRCEDGRLVALGALEPKFWTSFVTALGMAELAPHGLDAGQDGAEAARRVAARMAQAPAEHWIGYGRTHGVPISQVRTVPEALGAPEYDTLAGHALFGLADPSVRRRPSPRLGQHTQAVLQEFGGA
jgi:crotonobetainyl-CoA:carnitine CoA-transferase CaiB-like acyl-CoA transferase